MIDTENVTCDTCTAPSEFVFDASDEVSRGWPRVDIELNPFKGDFPLLAQHPELAFLDSGATAQRPACVLEAQKSFYETMNANPLRGLYSLSVEATEAIAKVRSQIAELIGAVDERGRARTNEVVFCRNTSEALNIVAKGFAPHVLEPGDEVAISIMEHHSNLIPWQQVCRETGAKLVYLYPTPTGQITDDEIAAKIGPATKIVSCGHVSNVLGVENPIAKLAAAAHANGAYMVVDAAQSVPHMALDVRELGADFLAFSAHKALGPMGVGVLWGRTDLLDRTDPVYTGGEMIESVTREGAVWAEVPHKFEAGTVNAGGAYALAEAIRYMNTIGFDAIEEQENKLTRIAYEGMTKIPGIRVLGSSDPDNHHGILSFAVDGVHPHDVAEILNADNICVRAGHHCAQPLLQYLGTASTTRVSLAFYNTEDEIRAFLTSLGGLRRKMGYE